MSGISGRYARAIFEASQQRNCLKETLDDLLAANDLFEQNDELPALLAAPVLPQNEKEKLVFKIFKGRVNELVQRLVTILSANGRIKHYSSVIQEYGRLYDEYAGIQQVIAHTATALGAQDRQVLIKKLEQKSQKKILLSEQIDPSLIGGMVLQFGDYYLDYSVKGRLERLGESLLGISKERGI